MNNVNETKVKSILNYYCKRSCVGSFVRIVQPLQLQGLTQRLVTAQTLVSKRNVFCAFFVPFSCDVEGNHELPVSMGLQYRKVGKMIKQLYSKTKFTFLLKSLLAFSKRNIHSIKKTTFFRKLLPTLL